MRLHHCVLKERSTVVTTTIQHNTTKIYGDLACKAYRAKMILCESGGLNLYFDTHFVFGQDTISKTRANGQFRLFNLGPASLHVRMRHGLRVPASLLYSCAWIKTWARGSQNGFHLNFCFRSPTPHLHYSLHWCSNKRVVVMLISIVSPGRKLTQYTHSENNACFFVAFFFKNLQNLMSAFDPEDSNVTALI